MNGYQIAYNTLYLKESQEDFDEFYKGVKLNYYTNVFLC